MLTEVYRQARTLWPARAEHAGVSVTIRIDQIRELPPDNIKDGHAWGEAWMLVRQNSQEAVVQQTQLYSILERSVMEEDTDGSQARLLAFWWRDAVSDAVSDDAVSEDAFVAELEHIRKRRMERAGTLKRASLSLAA